jgi:hypothetical protein
MPLNYLQRVAMIAMRTASPVRPVAFGPPPMPGTWTGLGAKAVFSTGNGASPAPAADAGVSESKGRAVSAHSMRQPDAPSESPKPPRFVEEPQQPARPSPPLEYKPTAAFDLLLGSTPPTVVRVPRTLRRAKPTEPVGPPVQIQPLATGPVPDPKHPHTGTEPAQIEPLTLSGVADQPQSLPEPERLPEMIAQHPVEHVALGKLRDGQRQRAGPPQTSAEPARIKRLTLSNAARQPTPLLGPEQHPAKETSALPEVIAQAQAEPDAVRELHVEHPVLVQRETNSRQAENNEPAQGIVISQPEKAKPGIVPPVPVQLAQALETPGPRLDCAQPKNHTTPVRLLFPRRRESRISIGRVEVQVNNRPTAVPPPALAPVPVPAGDSLSARYLSRFPLRP